MNRRIPCSLFQGSGNMAICNFRADSFEFGLLEGKDLNRVLGLLEKVKAGLPIAEAGEEEASWIRAFVKSGLLSVKEGKAFLESEGEGLLKTCRQLLKQAPALERNST